MPAAVSSIRRSGGFAITSFALSRTTGDEPLVALGIAPGKSKEEVHLAVRLQRRSLLRSSAMLDEIKKRSKDEVDIRFVGRITPHTLHGTGRDCGRCSRVARSVITR